MTEPQEKTFAQKLAPDWLESVKRKMKLHDRAIAQSLNLPIEDDVNITHNTEMKKTGITWKEILALGTVTVASLLAFPSVKESIFPTPKPTPIVTTPSENANQSGKIVVPDSEYTVRFYDKDGNLIEVPHISQRVKVEPEQ
jgi:hypothetical protein